MQVLSFGYKLPETGDFGDVWFPALEDNITRVNSHNHDGTNSSKLASSSITAVHQTVNSGDFSLVSGEYRATVNMPGGLDYDDYIIVCKDPASQDQVYLKVEKITDSQFYLYTNTQQDYEVYFVS